MELLPLTLLLVGAFAASMLTSFLQHRYYIRTVNRLAKAEHRPGLVLVTGRARGRLRGAIVLLLVDRHAHNVERALVMQGISVFARFRESPELAGPVRRLEDDALPAPLRRAFNDALHQYEQRSQGVRESQGR